LIDTHKDTQMNFTTKTHGTKRERQRRNEKYRPRPCKFFNTSGGCKNGDSCPFKHSGPQQRRPTRGPQQRRPTRGPQQRRPTRGLTEEQQRTGHVSLPDVDTTIYCEYRLNEDNEMKPVFIYLEDEYDKCPILG